MAQAEANRVRISVVAEPDATLGVTPTNPVFQTLRLTSSDFAANKQTQVSEELRSDRMTSDLVETGFETSGTLNIETSLGGSYDDVLASAIASTFSTALPVAQGDFDVTVSSGTAAIADAGTTGQFTNVTVGQWLYFANFANATNNGWWKVSVKTDSNNITVLDPGDVMVNETGAGDQYIRGKTIINGTRKSSFSVEQAFLDIDVAQLFKGMRVGSWAANVESGSILTGSFSFQGTEMTTDSGAPFTWLGSGSYTAATTSPVLNATSNVGTVVKDGVALTTAIQSFNLELDNALRSQMAIGNKYPIGIGYGRVQISGSITAYFEDLTLYNEMINHDDVSLEFDFTDTDGNAMHIELPRVKFGSSNPAAPGIDQDVMEDIEWQAIADTTGTYMIRVDIADVA